MTYLIGIDDAGRGPVIGPLILAGVLIKKEDQEKLKEIGAKDSKLLTQKRRLTIKKEIESIGKEIFSIVTTPKEIDDCENLNNLEAEKTAMIINKLSEKLDREIEVIVDCPSVNIKSWQNFLEKFVINKNIKIKAEHKADFNHPVVSAASIIAKETREEEIAKLKKEYKIDFGSGYPSDPTTIEFIEKNFKNEKYKEIIRHSWETVKKLKEKNKQKSLF